ncbi:hypothetical protein J6590_031319 [Homalodisca vitripennis]|nr:hypothetical protein J6590_031319 [Homalodisca vitripennis]
MIWWRDENSQWHLFKLITPYDVTASYDHTGALPRERKRAFLAECEEIHKTGDDIDEILDKWLIPTTDKGKLRDWGGCHPKKGDIRCGPPPPPPLCYATACIGVMTF